MVDRLTFDQAPALGALMMGVLSPMSQLHSVEVYSQSVATSGSPYVVIRPLDAPAQFPVVVEASGLNASLRVQLRTPPDSGLGQVYNATLDNRAANPARATIQVTLPPNIRAKLHAFVGNNLP